MDFISEISLSEEYRNFRCNVPLRKISTNVKCSKLWRVYDAGSKQVKAPLVFFPPVSGTADCYFQQLLSLTARGVRVILVDSPVYWNVAEWCEGFRLLLDELNLKKVHIFGASLGGFLAQKFCEYTQNYPRVSSVILCNTYTDTKIFNYKNTATVFKMLPTSLLRTYITPFPEKKLLDPQIADSIDFMKERLLTLNRNELASRLTLTCADNYVQPQKIKVKVTVMDVFDESALLQSAKDDMYKCYPQSRRAHLKSGGNFPYLSRRDQVNLYILVHLQEFMNDPDDCPFVST